MGKATEALMAESEKRVNPEKLRTYIQHQTDKTFRFCMAWMYVEKSLRTKVVRLLQQYLQRRATPDESE